MSEIFFWQIICPKKVIFGWVWAILNKFERVLTSLSKFVWVSASLREFVQVCASLNEFEFSNNMPQKCHIVGILATFLGLKLSLYFVSFQVLFWASERPSNSCLKWWKISKTLKFLKNYWNTCKNLILYHFSQFLLETKKNYHKRWSLGLFSPYIWLVSDQKIFTYRPKIYFKNPKNFKNL